MRYNKSKLLQMDSIEVYKLRLDGTISKFPNGFFSKEVGVKLTRYLIEEKLKWSQKDICENLSKKTFEENVLLGMLVVVFNSSPYEAINNTYPGKFKPWQLKNLPKNYLNKEIAKEAVKWLIEEKLKWSEKDICENLSQKTFLENGFSAMLKIVYNNSPYEAIDNAYPGKFKPWQLKNAPNNYWNKETAKEAVKWLIEEKLKWSEKDICENLSKKIFYENDLLGMLGVFNTSPYEAIDNAYPGKFKPWQLKKVPKNYWNKETAKEAAKWLIEEKLKWNDEDICENLSKKTFEENGLLGMLGVFNASPYEAIDNAYPGKFKPWQLKSVSKNYWNKETGKETVKWLIEEKLKWSHEDICQKLSTKMFKENGLLGMLNIVFNGSPYEAIDNAYPGKYIKVGYKIKMKNNLIV